MVIRKFYSTSSAARRAANKYNSLVIRNDAYYFDGFFYRCYVVHVDDSYICHIVLSKSL